MKIDHAPACDRPGETLQTAGGGGCLHLVSAGIGDADNMTLRAYRVIQAADVILGMSFVLAGLESLLNGKERHDAGHGLFTRLARRALSDADAAQQEARVRQVIRRAHADGKRVAVLEFGDPTLFGPQIGYLREFADLSPVVVPGVSSFNAANALLALPLLGGGNDALRLTTLAGLRRRGAAPGEPTVLFSMGMDWQALQDELTHGLPPETPVALVSHAGFRDRQSVLQSCVGNLAADATGADTPWASLVYVGVDQHA